MDFFIKARREFVEGSMRLTHKKTVFSHKLSTFFWSSKLSHKKTKKTKQSAFHTDLVYVLASFFYYESYIGLVEKWKVHNGGLVLKNLIYIF